MSIQDSSNRDAGKDQQGFPVELKLLLAVIAVGVLAMALKATGII